MTLDLDTFLVVLYTIIDDLYQTQVAPQLPRGPGKRPEVSDSEVLTLARCAQWLRRSERAVVRYAREHWRAYFPRVLSQSAYNRRSRRLAGVLVQLGPLVAQEPMVLVSWLEVVMRFLHSARERETLAIGGRAHDHRGFYHRVVLSDRCRHDGRP